MNVSRSNIIEMFLIRALEKILADKDIKKSYHSELRNECIKALGEIKELTKLRPEDSISSILPSVLEKPAFSLTNSEENEIGSIYSSIDISESHKDSLSQETISIDGTNSIINAEKYFYPFELACQSPCSRIVIISLDCIQKLLAYGHLVGNGPDTYPKQSELDNGQDKLMSGEKFSELVSCKSDLLPFSLLCPSPGWKYNNDRLIDRIVRVICGCMENQGVKEGVHLQIIKALLTIITSQRCQIHEGSLLLAVRTCYNIHLGSKSIVNQTTAKATLNQMLSVIFGKMEAHNLEYCLKHCGLLGETALVPHGTSSNPKIQNSPPSYESLKIDGENSKHTMRLQFSGDDIKYFVEDEIEASVLCLMDHMLCRVEESLICVLDPELGEESQPNDSHEAIAYRADVDAKDEFQAPTETVYGRIRTRSGTHFMISSPARRRPSYHGVSDGNFDHADHAIVHDPTLIIEPVKGKDDVGSPMAEVHGRPDLKLRPYRCKVSYTLRRDAFLLFRALCRLALKPFATGPASAQPPSTFLQHLSALGNASTHNTKDNLRRNLAGATGSHYFHHMLRSKTLSLQLLQTVLEQAGPVFCSEEPLFRKGACGHVFAALVPAFGPALVYFGSPDPTTPHPPPHPTTDRLAAAAAAASTPTSNLPGQNDILTDVKLLETALTLFASMLDKFKKNMKLQIEIFFREIYLKVLENPFPNEYKLMVLNALTTLCENPQNVVDLYVNYDCDLSATNIFSRLVSALSRLASQQHVTSDASSDKTNPGFASIKLMGLRCLVAISRCMAQWCEDLYSATNSPLSDTNFSPPPPVSDDEDGGDTAKLDDLRRHDHDNEYSGRSSQTKGSGHHQPSSTRKSDRNAGSFRRRRRSKTGQWNINTRADGFKNRFETASALEKDHLPDGANDNGNSGSGMAAPDDHPARYEDMKRKKEIIEAGIAMFKKKPAKGIAYLQENTDVLGRTPDDIASFFYTETRLDKDAIGDYLGENDKFNKEAMYAYVDLMDFHGKGFVQALREFLERFKLPGEAQKVDRLMQKFAARYVENNASLGLFQSADSAYVLAFSIIMLTTDLHNPQVKHKMTKEEYIRINRNTNDQKDLPESYLSQIYDEIAENRLKMKEKGTDSPKSLSDPTKNEFRSAMYIEHVRPMFKITWTPMLAAFSVSLQDCDDIEIVSLCLEGMKNAIRIACIFQLELERNAFIQALSHFTLLTAVAYPATTHSPQIKTKNLLTIKTLISIAQTDGNFLGSSWFDFLKCISQLELAQIIANRTNVSHGTVGNPSAHFKFTGGMGKSGSTLPTPDTTVNYALANGCDETSSIPESTHGSVRVGTSREPSEYFDEERGSSIRTRCGSMEPAWMDDHQSLLVEVDKVFTGSVMLNGEAITDFVAALCRVSLEELSGPGLERVGPGGVRMFSLQKIVEISYYNMARIRLQWTKIWAILGPHFNKVGCHHLEAVAFFALDSLRQLSMKFLEKGELANFRFQKDFLRPFEYIMKNNTSINIADMTVRCVTQMIRSQAHNIKSGWKNVFSVFQIAASHPDENILIMAFQATTFVINNLAEPQFIYIVDSFQNAVKCLSEFACNSKFMDTNMEAIRLLRNSAQFVYDDPQAFKEFGHEEITVDEDDYPWVKGWFPILFELSCVINRCSLDVRTRALTVMFDILKSFGHVFAPHWWKDFFRVLFRIFDNFKIPDAKSEKSEWMTTTCNHALYAIVDIFSQFYDPLCTGMLSDFYEQLKWCLKQGNEQLARAALNCFENMVLTNGSKYKVREWDLTCKMIVDIFRDTLPYELLNYKAVANVTVKECATISQASFASSPSASYVYGHEDSSLLNESLERISLSESLASNESDSANRSLKKHSSTDSPQMNDPAANMRLAVQCVIQFELILCVERIVFHQYYPSGLDTTLSHAYFPASTPQLGDVPGTLHSFKVNRNTFPDFDDDKISNSFRINPLWGDSNNTEEASPGIRPSRINEFNKRACDRNAPDSPYAYPQYSSTAIITEASVSTESFYELMSPKQLVLIVEFLLDSHKFAKSFNSDAQLRDQLHRSGFKGNAKPNLLKQETVSFALALNILFRMFDDERKQYEWPLIRDKLIGHTLEALKYFLKIQSKAHRDSWNRIILTLLTRLLIIKDPKFRLLVLPLYTQLCELITLGFEAEIRSLLKSLFLKIGLSFVESITPKQDPPSVIPITSFQQTRLI